MNTWVANLNALGEAWLAAVIRAAWQGGLALLVATNRSARNRLNLCPVPATLTAPFPSVNRMSGAASTERRSAAVAAI